MKKKYLCIGGEIISKSDGEVHYISALRLCELYNIKPEDCRMIEEKNLGALVGINQTEHIVLRPKYDGNYKL